MIVPDLNLLIYAHNEEAPYHASAKAWWEGLVNGEETIGVPWIVSTGFIRLMTHPRVLVHPATVMRAVDYVHEWFRFHHVIPLNPGTEFLGYFRQNLVDAGIGANLVTDAHIAALAMENQAEVHSNDIDFSRFRGLRWRNPL